MATWYVAHAQGNTPEPFPDWWKRNRQRVAQLAHQTRTATP